MTPLEYERSWQKVAESIQEQMIIVTAEFDNDSRQLPLLLIIIVTWHHFFFKRRQANISMNFLKLFISMIFFLW